MFNVAIDPVVKRLMLTAINYSIGEARERARLAGLLELKKSLDVASSEDFRVGMICGEAFARAAVMIRMYMGRELSHEEAAELLGLLAKRGSDLHDSLVRRP